MFKIRQATDAIAKLDNIDDTKKLDQSLRHLSQRVYFPAEGREGRADLYPLHAICALRILHTASSAGLERAEVERLARWLLSEPTGPSRKVAVEGGFRPMSPAEEAVARVGEDQSFDFIFSYRRNGAHQLFANWPDDEPQAKAVVDGIFASVGLPSVEDVELVRTTIPASLLIGELLAELGA